MEHLDNDMDDLFQKAGELYPLKISGSDWETVAGKLQDPNSGDLNDVSRFAVRGTGKKRRWRLLLLLIPLSLAGLIYNSARLHTDQTISKNGKTISNPVINHDEIKKKSSAAVDETTSTTEHPLADNKTVDNVNPLNKERPAQAASAKKETGKSKASSNPDAVPPVLSPTRQSAIRNDAVSVDAYSENSSSLSNKDKNKTNSKQPDNKSSTGTSADPLAPASAVAAVPVTPSNEPPATKSNPVAEEKSKSLTTDSASKKKTSGADAKTSRGFYAGLLAGPDLSTVKFQSIKQTGFSLGVLIGYRFNKRIAIESGLLWDKKYYYSNGEYFKKENINIPPSEKVINVDGSCYMFEIPLNFRYDFATAKNHGFFAKTGLSSYIGMKDQYTLQLDYGGNPYPRNSPVKNAPANILSILQFSAGYERSIGAKTNLRVEPYVKIPLQGVGTGSMPISSFGIYFGITHSFR